MLDEALVLGFLQEDDEPFLAQHVKNPLG